MERERRINDPHSKQSTWGVWCNFTLLEKLSYDKPGCNNSKGYALFAGARKLIIKLMRKLKKSIGGPCKAVLKIGVIIIKLGRS